MTRLSDDQLEAIRKRRVHPETRMQDGRDIDTLLAEVDRLREGEKFAREWLKSTRGPGEFGIDVVTLSHYEAREAFRAWCEAQK